MTTRSSIVLAGALALSVTPLAGAQELPDAEQFITRYEDAFNGGDAEKLAALFAEDAVILAPDADPVEGRSAIGAHFTEMLGTMSPKNLEVRSRGVHPLGETAAFDEGTYSFEAGAEGQAAMVQGDYLVVLERGEGEEWLITRQILNQDSPAATTGSAQ